MRVAHPKALSLPRLTGMLGHIGQNAAQWIGYRGAWTMVIGTITMAGAGVPIKGAVLHIGRHRLLDMRQQRLACVWGDAGHRLSTPGTWGHIFGAEHRPLPYMIFSSGDILHAKP
jgi:hypothetical protein